jgi:hypothetical protein
MTASLGSTGELTTTWSNPLALENFSPASRLYVAASQAPPAKVSTQCSEQRQVTGSRAERMTPPKRLGRACNRPRRAAADGEAAQASPFPDAYRTSTHSRFSAATNDTHRSLAQGGDMAQQVEIRNSRAKITALALVVSLVGGTVGMDVVASSLSREIAKTDRSAPVLVAPSTGLRSAV